MAFEVSKQQNLVAQDAPGTHGLIRSLTNKSIVAFKATPAAANYGVYIFGLRSSGGAVMPWYVGLAKQQTFGAEAIAKDKLRKYSAAMFGRTGSPVITLVSWSKTDPEAFIDDLERFLIWIARAKNPRLLNERKISSAPKSIIALVNKIEIKGVLKRGPGQPSLAAQEFRAHMGIA